MCSHAIAPHDPRYKIATRGASSTSMKSCGCLKSSRRMAGRCLG